jgi:two-component system response regulator AlgR
MPGIDGMEVARRLAVRKDAPAIIFCTAYDQHALAAFEAKALDYLLKPVRRERLIAALERARRYTGEASTEPKPAKSQRTHLCARVRGDMKLVPITSIAYFLADAKYVEVHYDGGDVLIEDSLVGLEEEFSERFVRIHRNCLVARDRLDSLGKNASGEPTVRLRGRNEALEVSRRNLAQVRKLIRGK